MATPWVPTVSQLVDGQPVEAATSNPIFAQLVQRDQYLFDRFNSLADRSALTVEGLPIHPDYIEELATVPMLVYYRYDTPAKQGLAPAVAGYSSGTVVFPADSAFVIGIVYNVDITSKLADVWLGGLLTFNSASDLQTLLGGVTPVSGKPCYLKATGGKMSMEPSGIVAYMGVVISSTQFLFAPNVEGLHSFYTQYRFQIYDKPGGVAVLDEGSPKHWDVTADPTKVGWISTAAAALAGIPVPTGAVFYYWVPNDATTDTELSPAEQELAAATAAALPPSPLSYASLTSNGIKLSAYDDSDPTLGDYIITDAGLWWTSNAEGKQPWSDQIINSWGTYSSGPVGRGDSFTRKYLYLDFVRFSPDVLNALVTGLKASSAISLSSSSASTSAGVTTYKGVITVGLNVVNSTTSTTSTSGQAIKSVEFDNATGKLLKTSGPVVTGIQGGESITVTSDNTGGYTVSYNGSGTGGLITDIEPENTLLEYYRLVSYLKFQAGTGLPVNGAYCKASIPSTVTSRTPLKLTLEGFPLTSPSTNSIQFNLAYQWHKLGGIPGDLTSVSLSSYTFAGQNALTSVSIPLLGVTAGTTIIPVPENFAGGTLYFRLTRVASSYTGAFGLTSIRWAI